MPIQSTAATSDALRYLQDGLDAVATGVEHYGLGSDLRVGSMDACRDLLRFAHG